MAIDFSKAPTKPSVTNAMTVEQIKNVKKNTDRANFYLNELLKLQLSTDPGSWIGQKQYYAGAILFHLKYVEEDVKNQNQIICDEYDATHIVADKLKKECPKGLSLDNVEILCGGSVTKL